MHTLISNYDLALEAYLRMARLCGLCGYPLLPGEEMVHRQCLIELTFSQVEEAEMTTCDHVVFFHGGHEAVRVSELAEYFEENEFNTTEWCCGGGMFLRFCPDCGERNVLPEGAIIL